MHIFFEYLHFILNLNVELPGLFQSYGLWIYGLVFLIIFLESGIILAPFLPGESMLFALGTVTAVGKVEPHTFVVLLATAAALGGFINYGIGFFIGKRLMHRVKSPLFQKGMNKAAVFYQKHGASAVLLARLVPIVRTFVPFFGGMVKMRFGIFSLYNILGGILWIAAFIYAGFFFGQIPIVQKHFSWIVIMIIVISMVPITIEAIKMFRKKDHESAV